MAQIIAVPAQMAVTDDSTGRIFKLPEFESIFKYKASLFANEEELINEWVNEMYATSGISKERFERISCCKMFAQYFHPFCTTIQRYEYLVKTYIQFFVYDDHTETDWGDVARSEDTSRLVWGQFNQIFEKLNDPKINLDLDKFATYSLSQLSICQAIWAEFNPVQRLRYKQIWQEYIQGNIDETSYMINHVDRGQCDRNQMTEIRMASVASMCIMQLIEYGSGIFVPRDDWDSHLFQQLLQLAARTIMYSNDIYSFEKEYRENHDDLVKMYNVVANKALEISLTKDLTDDVSKDAIKDIVNEAMQKVAHENRCLEKETMRVMEELLNDPAISQSTKEFIKQLKYLIGGNYYVSFVVERYNPDSPSFKHYTKQNE